ncbi:MULTISPECIES: DUF1338 domain-containing protein [Salinivibrio]|uniref:2-oxoadipate dioxygenase/decarboxylase n=2 Tax=Salinivibrio TaxID=51366 RepID=A0ABY7LF75_9GAMM|nr:MULTISPECIES: DUF1338 domain-containing protein [Salinivibrio]ODP96719.1 succinyldiaminopimelate aminotransferase [Salinivibrio sp. DV]OOF14396.1 succinyldiaminopimelate aminotransferase [Salinivibrio sp. PR919]OOF17361.1 succinyldiaminopimelate aminotransferase [Salinivibrio sp. PR932]QIR05115.1 DUF1338 domain-containing protein [Salinivibrio costicola]WBA14994.1 DUF1338 domain-containing protein [Salinivibrio proteolyticus]
MDSCQALFDRLWQDYTQRLCPSAQKVHGLLEEGQPLINDHIALRTFALPNVGLDKLARPFIALGYEPKGEYTFEAKKLNARHYEHPDPLMPKVFISELMVGQCSTTLQSIVRDLVANVDDDALKGSDFLHQGRLWELDWQTYKTLADESEYAAWVAAHGYGANHFTVSVNQLNNHDSCQAVNDTLRQNGFTINESGGEVKGDASVFLEQSSTMADRVPVQFSDARHDIPGGFYEFAKRYPLPDGELYQGFVAASADKIFESTHQ